MARILLAGNPSSTQQELSSALSSQGWAVKSVASREQALVAASEEAPNLVVVQQKLHGVEELVRRFSRQRGGPGVVLVAGHDDPELALSGVEAVLRTPLKTDELVRTVRDRLAAAEERQGAPRGFMPPRPGKRLTSQDIFGDLLTDIVDGDEGLPAEAAPDASPSAAFAETVEAVLPDPPEPAAGAGASGPPTGPPAGATAAPPTAGPPQPPAATAGAAQAAAEPPAPAREAAGPPRPAEAPPPSPATAVTPPERPARGEVDAVAATEPSLSPAAGAEPLTERRGTAPPPLIHERRETIEPAAEPGVPFEPPAAAPTAKPALEPPEPDAAPVSAVAVDRPEETEHPPPPSAEPPAAAAERAGTEVPPPLPRPEPAAPADVVRPAARPRAASTDIDSLLAELALTESPKPSRPAAAPPPQQAEDPLDRTLAGVLAESLQGARQGEPTASPPQTEREVDSMLSRTLVGLQISDLLGDRGARAAEKPREARAAAPPSAAPPADAPPEQVDVLPPEAGPPPAGTIEAPPRESSGAAASPAEPALPAETFEAPPQEPGAAASPAETPPPLPAEPATPLPLAGEPPLAALDFDTAAVTIDEIAALELEDGESLSAFEPTAGATPAAPDPFETRALEALGLESDELLAGLVAQPPPAGLEAPPAEEPPGDADELWDFENVAPEAEGFEEEPDAAVDDDGAEPRDEVDPAAIFGDYTLEERIGVGAMAEVWRARRKGVEGFEKQVALKRILPHLVDNPEFVEMFIDEAKLAAQLNHNNITHIFDFGKTGDEYFIAMEYVDGRDLRSILNAGKEAHDPLPGGLALFIASRIATALDYAHRRRDLDDRELALVHRDISPQNVLINNEGEIKLCDFGIAKAVSKVSTTQIGSLKGKLRYMSPEQAWGKPVDPRSDIFSLGSLLFEMLSGEPLFSGETEIAVLEAVRMCRVESRVTGASGVPGPLHSVLLKALARDPDERFQTAREMQVEIDRLHHSLSGAPGQGQLARYLEDLFSEESEETPLEGADLDVPETVRRKTVPIAPAAPSRPPTAVGVEPEALAAEWEPYPPTRDQRSRVRRIALILAILVPLLAIGIFFLINRAQRDAVPEQPPEPAPAGESPSAASAAAEAGGEEAAAALAAVETEAAVAAPVPATAPPAGAEPRGANRVAARPVEPRAVAAPLPPADETRPAPVPAAQDEGGAPVPAPLPRRTEEELRRVEELLAAASAADPAREATSPPVDGAAPQAEPVAAVAAPPAADASVAAAETTLADAPSPADAGQPAGRPPVTPATGPAPAGEVALAANRPQGPDALLATPASEAAPRAGTPAGAAPPTPPQPAVAEGDLVQPGPGVVPPRLERYAAPAYTALARRMRVEGDVIVSVLVDERGRVLDARLAQGLPAKVGLDEAAVDAARSARFTPATKEGVRVKMWYDLVSRFRL